MHSTASNNFAFCASEASRSQPKHFRTSRFTPHPIGGSGLWFFYSSSGPKKRRSGKLSTHNPLQLSKDSSMRSQAPNYESRIWAQGAIGVRLGAERSCRRSAGVVVKKGFHGLLLLFTKR